MKLAYETWGRGSRPVVALHGFTHDRTAFRHLEPMLGGSLQVIAVDLPGHGETPLPERAGRDGFMETVDALVRLLDTLGLRQAALLGYSQGARLALGAALHAPDRFARLVLESGSPGLHRRQERAERRAADGQWVELLRREGLDAFLSRWQRLPLFASLAALPRARAEALAVRRSSASAASLAGALECLGLGVQPDYWPELHGQRVPTLLLTGALDTKFTELAKRMATELPVVWRRTFSDCGHAPHLEAPEAFAAEVLSFLETPWYDAPDFETVDPTSPPHNP